MTLAKSLAAALSWLTLVQATCQVTSTSDSGTTLFKGTVLTSAGALPNARLLVSNGRISYVGRQCGFKADESDATVIECVGSVISPGFINTHEHIEYATVTPLKDIGERADHRHDWRRATAWGELRHLFSGTTSIVGGAMAPGLTRNLDYVAGVGPEIPAPVATWDIFPLNDAAGILRNGDCDYGPNMTTAEKAGKLYRYIAHVGEGVDAEAENEFRCLSSATYDTTPMAGGGGLSTDIIAPNLALIHALGLTKSDFDLVAARQATVVWSPRSNVFLYGKTLDVQYLLDAGITVALGTDWLPSGSATMAREAVCGFAATKACYGHALDAKTLWEMMTINAAKVAGFDRHLGSFEVGKLADVAVFAGAPREDAFAQAVFSSGEDVELVMRGGKVLLAAEKIKRAATGACESVVVGHSNKTLCVEEELGRSYAEFESKLGGVYPALLPGVPSGEPTCEPTR
ncbi:5-methylthioadenosine/S-adenosylhomocysteine deaminase like protein [Verticillium longisporum]|uniref:5-methylthioadenosine/S-adenosylhomocysteine deaminase like protein n=1 Tax=Verticillium longisporum TaxID=100787 RepID=A0A8I3AHN4_VERLO|nr:5-methylthioadenosine/S-adenosylhomocysteine deaminase like protein [Verticillium longisporum]